MTSVPILGGDNLFERQFLFMSMSNLMDIQISSNIALDLLLISAAAGDSSMICRTDRLRHGLSSVRLITS